MGRSRKINGKMRSRSPLNQGNNNGGKWGGARWNDMLLMKTASLGLLEVMVVRVNAWKFSNYF